MKHTRSLLVSSALLASAFVAGTEHAARADCTHTVIVKDYAFVPAVIEVVPGDTIKWVWESGLHTVTSGVGCGALGELFHEFVFIGNKQFTWTVPDDFVPGEIPYVCLPHCTHPMDGLIVVGESNGDPKDPCVPADLNCDGSVGVPDLLLLLANWGPCPPKPEHCHADLTANGSVGVADLLVLLANWG